MRLLNVEPQRTSFPYKRNFQEWIVYSKAETVKIGIPFLSCSVFNDFDCRVKDVSGPTATLLSQFRLLDIL